MAHVQELDDAISAAIGARTLADNLAIIDSNQLTAVHVQTVADIEQHSHWQFRQVTVDVADESGAVRMHNVTPRLSETPGRIRWTGGALGRDNADVFGELGVGAGDLDRLRRDGVI